MGNKLPNHPSRAVAAEPESLEQLIGDCHRMAARWTAPASHASAAGRTARPAGAAGAAAANLHGIVVPPTSAHIVDGMADYGD